jgi:hypothetical protein
MMAVKPSQALAALKKAVDAEPRENPVTWERLSELLHDAEADVESSEYYDYMGEDM